MAYIDKRTRIVLQFLLEEHCDENYKVLSKEDIVSALPKKFAFGVVQLNVLLKLLLNRQHVAVKFDSEDEICIMVTPRGVALVKDEIEEEKVKTTLGWKVYLVISAVTFFAAFAGAFLGVLLGS